MPYTMKFNEQKGESKKIEIKTPKGNIYLISAGSVYKIGSATVVETRLKQLSTGSPIPLTVLYSFEVELDQMKYIETTLHKRFSIKKSHLEWFNLDESDVEWIKTLNENTVGAWIEEMEDLKKRQEAWEKIIAKISRETENFRSEYEWLDIKEILDSKTKELEVAQTSLSDVELQISNCK